MKPILRTIERPAWQAGGFTLLELMLAITIGGVILGAIHTAFTTAIDTQRRIARVASDSQLWRFFSDRLRTDVKNLTLGDQTLSGDQQMLRLYSLLPGHSVQEIRYRFESSAAGGQIRRHYRTAVSADEADEKETGFETLLVEGVERLAFRYLIDGNWRNRTATDDGDNLPQAVECIVVRGGRERRLVIGIEVQHAPG